MSEAEAAPGSATTDGTARPSLLLDGGLSPAKAGVERERALAVLAEAKSGAGLTLDLTGDQARPTALQLLVATLKSARASGVAVTILPGAEAALARLDQNLPVGS